MVVKIIARVTYWLGIVCTSMALILRLSNALGFESGSFITRGNSLGYRSFLDGALMFLFASMASSLYTRLDSPRTPE